MAIGEKLDYPYLHVERAWDIIAIITYQLIISLLQRNFFIKQISYDKNKNTFKPKRHFLLKIIRKCFKLRVMRKIFRKFFLMQMKILKTR
jgi:hypothetical protein